MKKKVKNKEAEIVKISVFTASSIINTPESLESVAIHKKYVPKSQPKEIQEISQEVPMLSAPVKCSPCEQKRRDREAKKS